MLVRLSSLLEIKQCRSHISLCQSAVLHLLALGGGSYQVEAHLDVVEVLGLGDGGGQPAVAEVASHQLSVCT